MMNELTCGEAILSHLPPVMFPLVYICLCHTLAGVQFRGRVIPLTSDPHFPALVSYLVLH